MSQELDIRFSYNSLLTAYRPDIYLWGNKQFLSWAQDPKVGYTSVEFSPLWRTAYEVITSPAEDIKHSYPVKSAFAAYNPYAKLKSILGREKDPRYPKNPRPFSRSELTFSTPFHNLLSIRKLEKSVPDLTVVNETGQPFKRSLIRYPNHGFSREQFEALQQGDRIYGIAWNLGDKPREGLGMARSYSDLVNALSAGRVKQVRIQPEASFKVITATHSFKNETAEKIELVKKSGQHIPFIIDVPVSYLLESGAISRGGLYRKGTSNLKYWHHLIIEFLKAV